MVACRDTTAREESATGAPPGRLTLRWVWPEERTVALRGARLPIGRDDHAAVRLDGPGVSRQHAELYRQGPIYVVRDLGSTNGTWLGGRRIEHAPVSPGAVMRVGAWVGVFTLEQDSAAGFSELAPGVFGGQELATALAPLTRGTRPDLPVLLIGETGTGKERIARAVHHFSGRQGPFLAVNCAALPEQLAEAELFGYRRGAFTGAERASTGHFRAAHGGTLFLDETAELAPALQAKLLRVLEERAVLGLGESTPVAVDVQIVAAIQVPIAELVASQRLRRDLGARLSGLQIQLPPLVSRRADIAGLFRRFLTQQCGGHAPAVEARLVEALCIHDWPENVRELELVTRALLAVHGHEALLGRQHLPARLAKLLDDRPAERGLALPRERRTHDLDRLQDELKKNGGNVKAAAESLGISRQRIYRLLDGTTAEQRLNGGAAQELPGGDD